MSGPFATATELCEWTGLTLPTDLSRIQALLAAASAAIRRETGQVLSKVTGEIETFPPSSRDFLVLSQRPVTAITTITVSAVAYTDFRFTRAGVIYNGALSTGPGQGVAWSDGATVTYDHGYAETDSEFAAIRAICIEAAARALQGPTEGPEFGGISPETVGWATQMFLTEREKADLRDLGKVGVG